MEVTIPMSLSVAQLVISSLAESAAVGARRPVGSESAALAVWLPLVAGLLTHRRVIKSWPDANK